MSKLLAEQIAFVVVVVKSVTNAFDRVDGDTADVVRTICNGRIAYCDGDGDGDDDDASDGGGEIASLGKFCSGKTIGHVLRIDNRRQDNATFFTGLVSLAEVSTVFKLQIKNQEKNPK